MAATDIVVCIKKGGRVRKGKVRYWGRGGSRLRGRIRRRGCGVRPGGQDWSYVVDSSTMMAARPSEDRVDRIAFADAVTKDRCGNECK